MSAQRESPAVEAICVRVDYEVMKRVRRVAFRRRGDNRKPWSQREIFSEALRMWLKENPR